ncbi:MAG: hypothetical protein M1827_005957 [Pycnora praestabilis]|nr:MAG: hypothetical protein M1827_005957 [Pycnora praestabilis]
MPPFVSSHPRPERPAHDRRKSSPSYFGIVAEPTIDRNESDLEIHTRSSRSPPSSIPRPTAASPRTVPLDALPEYEAFRRQSESNNFSLGPGNLSHFSMSPTQRPNLGRAPSSKRQVQIASPMSMLSPGKNDPSNSEDRMEIDSGYFSRQTSQHPSQSDSPSLANVPRRDSSADMPTQILQRQQLSRLDDRHPRLSLGYNRVDPPSPSANSNQRPQRAETLPISPNGDSPGMVSPQRLVELFHSSPEKVLLLDLRVSSRFTLSRISGAINVCIPGILLKRASTGSERLVKAVQEDTHTTEAEKMKFTKWKESQCIAVYDESSSQIKDATSSVNTLSKFKSEGYQGGLYIVRGGFAAFLKSFSSSVDAVSRTGTASQSSHPLSIGQSKSGLAPIAGGCPIPASSMAVNPFFSTIRQNMDLIDGVGQMEIRHPSSMTEQSKLNLPAWILRASAEADKGEAVSRAFLKIEEAEQARLQKAFSCSVQYGSPASSGSRSLQMAGLEKGVKNRYKDILPYDHARVKLQDIPHDSCDYFNASHIRAKWSQRHYIATQGPTPATFNDFWRVVWEQDVRVIVVLTAEKEGNQVKCDRYWHHEKYGSMILRRSSEHQESLEPRASSRPSLGRRRSTNPYSAGVEGAPSPTSSSHQPSVTIRKFILSHADRPFEGTREITQLHYSSWPDLGTPAHPIHVLELVEKCNDIVKSIKSPVLSPKPGASGIDQHHPIVVHCSAGCGRTGTFCTIDSVIEMLKRQRKEKVPGGQNTLMEIDSSSTNNHPGCSQTTVDDEWVQRDDQDLVAMTVEDFRCQRVSMVQTIRQYVLCYETVLEWLCKQQPENSKAGKDGVRWSYQG